MVKVIRNFIPTDILKLFSRYVKIQQITGSYNNFQDDIVEYGSLDYYNDPLATAIQMQYVLPKVENATSLSLAPTYNYNRIYTNPAVCNPHLDRDACEISVSVKLWSTPDEAKWPIVAVEHETKTEISTVLNDGDGLLYNGILDNHWRDAMPKGQYDQAQAFFHFVNVDGEYSKEMFDTGRCEEQTHSRGLKNLRDKFEQEQISITNYMEKI